jgi:tripartite-type tricarboxylate transporter receptor subunit TctC
MNRQNRQTLLYRGAKALLLAACVLQPLAAAAQDFPSKPIRFMVAYPPGGATDIVARSLGPGMSERLGQPVVIENHGGAAGRIGAQLALQAPADGYTIVLMVIGSHLLRPLLERNLPFDPIKDFTPVTQIVETVLGIAANPRTGPKSLADMVAISKRSPGKLAYGTSGIGSETHLSMAQIDAVTGGRMTVVPYKGGGPAVIDLISGQIQLVAQPVATFINYAKSGKVRMLGVFLNKRWEGVPDIPTVSEVVPGFIKPAGGMGIWGPAGVAPERVKRLQQAIAATLHSPEVGDKLRAQGLLPVGNTSAEFAGDIARSSAVFQRLVKAAGLKPR